MSDLDTYTGVPRRLVLAQRLRKAITTATRIDLCECQLDDMLVFNDRPPVQFRDGKVRSATWGPRVPKPRSWGWDFGVVYHADGHAYGTQSRVVCIERHTATTKE